VNALSATHIIAITSEVMAKHGSGDILLISSVASLRARPRNFVYGSSKAFADFFALGLSYRLRGTGVFICIIRPGFTFTKLTSKMKPNPFALTPNEVGAIAVRGLNSRKRIVYTPRKLKIIMNFLRITPRFIFNKI
jgi:short-subunit dehydrogenase